MAKLWWPFEHEDMVAQTEPFRLPLLRVTGAILLSFSRPR
jgi:hypothetical protein